MPILRDNSQWAFLAPSDLRHHDLPTQAARGFNRGSTEELLNRAAATIERLNRDLGELRDARETWKRERERLEGRLEEARTRAEVLVGEAMIDAHKASQALKAAAEEDARALRARAEAMLEPARVEAQQLLDEARDEAERLVADARAEAEQSASQAEQHKLLAADVHNRSVASLRRALDALGARPAGADPAGEDVRPFRSVEHETAAEVGASGSP